MSSEVIVRLMEEMDSSCITRLEQEIFSDAWSEQGVLETRQQKHSLILVACEEKEIVGYIIFYYVIDEGEIARIAVAQKKRKQGVGSQLICGLEKACREKGISRILLDVRAGNQNAVQFYRTHGFETDGIRRNFYQNPGEDALLMSREID